MLLPLYRGDGGSGSWAPDPIITKPSYLKRLYCKENGKLDKPKLCFPKHGINPEEYP